MQNIWIQCLALLQISNMTLGTSINLLHLSSFAAKWEESYYFLLAHSPAFSMETASIFWAVSWHNHVYKFSRGLEVKRCAKSQAQRGYHKKPKIVFGSTPRCPCRLPSSCTSSALGLCFGPRDRSTPPAQDTRAQLILQHGAGRSSAAGPASKWHGVVLLPGHQRPPSCGAHVRQLPSCWLKDFALPEITESFYWTL